MDGNDTKKLKDPKYPARLHTNERYREVLKPLYNLSLICIGLPILFARQIFVWDKDASLVSFFNCTIYASWLLFIISIITYITFNFYSAKWIRSAWGLETSALGKNIDDHEIERNLDISFWSCIISFIIGALLLITFYFDKL